ncbi:MAG: hypothetical protein OXE78_09850 [Gammaproteobacteria bacterium]|nr:hypothetical protein [Gammaproteobacteria bacterium]
MGSEVPNTIQEYATTREHFQKVIRTKCLDVSPGEDWDAVVDTWKYNPENLMKNVMVDPLSLYFYEFLLYELPSDETSDEENAMHNLLEQKIG